MWSDIYICCIIQHVLNIQMLVEGKEGPMHHIGNGDSGSGHIVQPAHQWLGIEFRTGIRIVILRSLDERLKLKHTGMPRVHVTTRDKVCVSEIVETHPKVTKGTVRFHK